MNTVDHNNVVIFDDRGIPSIMCRFVRGIFDFKTSAELFDEELQKLA